MKKLVVYSGRPVISESVKDLPFDVRVVTHKNYSQHIARLSGHSVLTTSMPDGKTVGNILVKAYGSRGLSEALCQNNKVLPAVSPGSHLFGFFGDKTIGPMNLEHPRPIRMFYRNLSLPYGTLNDIKNADISIIGPGDIFKDSLPSALPYYKHIKDTFTILIAPLTDTYGYTSGEVCNIVNENLEHKVIDKAIVNSGVGKLDDKDLMLKPEPDKTNHVFADITNTDVYFTYHSNKIRKVLENELL